MTIDDFLDRLVVYRPELARLLGNVKASIMLSQAIYWQQRVPKDRPYGCPGSGWWYHTVDEWSEETALTKNEQLTSRKLLRQTSYWQEKRAGIPARMWFLVDLEELAKVLKGDFLIKGQEKSCQQPRQQNGQYVANKTSINRETLQSKITTEITNTNLEVGSSENTSTRKSDKPVLEPLDVNKQQDYLRLARLYCDIRSPGGFSVAKKKQWAACGGLSDEDKEQLSEWEENERCDIRVKQHRLAQQQVENQADAQLTELAASKEEEVLNGLSPALRETLLSIKMKTKVTS